jgi:hypothetical protein
VPVDNTKRCDFSTDIGHVEEGYFHRDPLQLIYNPPEIGYPDGMLPNDLLIKHQTPHNRYQARISTSSKLSGDLHGYRKFSKKEYDWDNNLPCAMQVFINSLTNAPQMSIPSKPTSVNQPTDPRMVFVKPTAHVYDSTGMLSPPFNDETTTIRTPPALECASDESSRLLAGYNLSPTSSMTLTVSPTQSPPSAPKAIKSYLCKSTPPYSPPPSSPNLTPPVYSSTSSMSTSDQVPMRDTQSTLKWEEHLPTPKFIKSSTTPPNSQYIYFQASPFPYLKPFSVPVPTQPHSNELLNAVHENDEPRSIITLRTTVGARPDEPMEFEFTPAVPSTISAPPNPVPFIHLFGPNKIPTMLET